MKRVFALLALLILVAALGLVLQGKAEERAVREILAEAQIDALAGLNRRNPQMLDAYFATVAEGAQPVGLAKTEQAYRVFVAQLPDNSTFQVHSFDMSSPEVHKEAGLARVTYQLHFGLLRGGATLFSAKATQNLALLKTARGWRISGGDALQLEDISGALSW